MFGRNTLAKKTGRHTPQKAGGRPRIAPVQQCVLCPMRGSGLDHASVMSSNMRVRIPPALPSACRAQVGGTRAYSCNIAGNRSASCSERFVAGCEPNRSPGIFGFTFGYGRSRGLPSRMAELPGFVARKEHSEKYSKGSHTWHTKTVF